MRKKNIILSVLLSVSVLVTGLGINPIFAFASSQNFIEPYGNVLNQISLAAVAWEEHSLCQE